MRLVAVLVGLLWLTLAPAQDNFPEVPPAWHRAVLLNVKGRRAALIIFAVVATATLLFVVASRRDVPLPFLSRYHVVRRPPLEAYHGMPSREVYWIESPMSAVTREFKRLSASGRSGGPDEPRLYGYHNEDSGEAWLVVPGQASFPRWPDPNDRPTVAGTETTWTTVLYAKPQSLPLQDSISRLFGH